MSQSHPASPDALLICISGPDQGKRFAVRESEIVVGRTIQCEVLSGDPDMVDQHASFVVRGGKLQFRALHGHLFLDGQRTIESSISLRQQLRIGRSLWELNGQEPAHVQGKWIENLSDRISTVAGVEKIQEFDARDMFSEVLKSRTDDEIEEYFTAGTPATTPPLQAVDTNWPKPWVFFKTFTLSALVYLGFVFAVKEFQNPNLVPGLIMTGAFLIPFSLLIFFYEMNVLRNVSLYQVVKLFLFGGITSLILSLFLFRWAHLDSWLGAMDAGLVEETGKAAALFLIINKLKYRSTLNGLLFGAAVGAGFAAFESAGYALVKGLNGGLNAMLDNITLRGVLSLMGGHTLWTAMVGAALWRVRGDRKFSVEMARDPRFLRIFGLAILLHMLWNSPIALPFYLKNIALGFVAWVVNLGLIQAGLVEVRDMQRHAGTMEGAKDGRLRSV